MYCMYLRKSRADLEAETRGEGETLARHKNILFSLSRKMKINITKIYQEVVSGETIASRPEMQKLLSDVETGMWKGVFVVEVERLARGDTMDQGLVAQTFKYSNTKIITPMKVYDPNDEFDEEYFEFGLFMSRREYKTTNRRLQRGRIQSVKEGKFVGNIPPYGYTRVKLKGEKGFTLEPYPEQANVVKLIFELYTNGELQGDGSYKRLGVSLIVRKLNDMKILAAKGGDWVTSSIRSILSNPVYIGKIRWNWRKTIKKMVDGQMVKERPRAKEKDWLLVDGLHEAIIDEEVFNLAQEYLSENPATPVPARYKVKNPLAGIVECGICGRNMNRKPYKSGYPDTLLCVGPTCPNVSSPLYLVEEKLLQVLADWLKVYKLEVKKQEEQENNLEVNIIKQSIENISNDLETLNKQLSSLHDFLEQGIYSTEVFLERSKVLNDKINTAKENKTELENKLNSIFIIEKNKKTIIPKVEKVLETYNRLENPKEKNDILKEVIDKVVYTKEEGGRWSGKVDDFTLDLYPKLPK
ncbi:recombinase family protein [Proteiniborus sp.]|uniref:recombinase family protein n=1 Tax=Proteiniborus sp. TaxID=2079015 RepID=UPI003317E1C2